MLEEPATTGHLPPLTHRRAGTRQPAPDHTGKPYGCGCKRLLEHKAYKTCHSCVDKDPARSVCRAGAMGSVVLYAVM